MTITLTLEQQLTPLATTLATVQEKIASLQEDETYLKEQIRALVPGADTYKAGGLTIVVSPNRRFNNNRALVAIPPELLPLVSHETTTTTIVVDKVKVSVLCPAQYDACFDEYATKIALK